MRGRFTPERRWRANGASGTCSRASTATRSSACAARSSRSSRATSCASCSSGSTSRPGTQVSGPDALAARARAARRLRGAAAHGKPKCCRRAWPATRSPGWTTCACRPHRLDAACATIRRGRASAHAGDRCARRRSCCCNAATWRCGQHCSRRRNRCRHALSSRAQAVAEHLRRTAPRFSTSWRPPRICCSTELEDRAGRTRRARHGQLPTASPACAPCWCRLRGGPRRAAGRGRRTACLASPMPGAGHWCADPAHRPRTRHDCDRSAASAAAQQRCRTSIEHVARTLLKRYGVVCWRLLAREAGVAAAWRELLRVYQRLEARGEIRGGRFIAGLSRRTVRVARSHRACCAACARRRTTARWSVFAAPTRSISSAPSSPARGCRASANTRVLYRDGVPIATLVSGQFSALEAMDEAANGPRAAACCARRANTLPRQRCGRWIAMRCGETTLAALASDGETEERRTCSSVSSFRLLVSPSPRLASHASINPLRTAISVKFRLISPPEFLLDVVQVRADGVR